MPSNTTYRPTNTSDFEASKLNFDAKGVTGSITAGTSSNIDLTVTDDELITGIWLVLNNATVGDYVAFQVVDGTGAFSGTAGTVLNTFVNNWYVPTSTAMQFDLIYPAKIYAGLTLRVVYHSVGSTAPFVAVNYKLHKVLV